VQANCSNLASTLAGAGNSDTIVLTGLCNGSFMLGAAQNVTLEGAASGTNGFDGTGQSMPALTGSAVGLTLRNLSVQNYNLTSVGAAVQLTPGAGALPVIDHDRFINNKVTSTFSLVFGAALEISHTDPTCPYTAPLTLTNSLFSGNTINDTLTGPGSAAAGAGLGVLPELRPHTHRERDDLRQHVLRQLDPDGRSLCIRGRPVPRGQPRHDRPAAHRAAVRQRVPVERDHRPGRVGHDVRRRRRVGHVGEPHEHRRCIHRQLAAGPDRRDRRSRARASGSCARSAPRP
jgi:hypothetical protein